MGWAWPRPGERTSNTAHEGGTTQPFAWLSFRLQIKVRGVVAGFDVNNQLRLAVVLARHGFFRRYQRWFVRVRLFAGRAQCANLDAELSGAETVLGDDGVLTALDRRPSGLTLPAGHRNKGDGRVVQRRAIERHVATQARSRAAAAADDG